MKNAAKIPDPRLKLFHDGYDYWREQCYLRDEDWRVLYPPPKGSA